MKNKKMRKIPAVLAAALILGLGSVTAAAAWKYLTPEKTAQEMEKDGILYRISECDNVEAFADHKIYLCVNDGSFYNADAFDYDEKTGAISRNEDYQGINLLFTLPFDEEKADPKKAKEYIRKIEKEMSESGDELEEKTEVGLWLEQITPDNIEQYAKRLKETVQLITPDKEGYIHVDWQVGDIAGSDENLVEALFPDGRPGMSKSMTCSSSGDRVEDALLGTYTLNEDGTVTFAIYVAK